MSLKFTLPPQERYEYGVWTDSGGFRVHRNLGSAKLSFMHRVNLRWGGKITRSRAVITRLVDGEWYVLYDVPLGTAKDELPWVKEVSTWGYWPSEGYGERTVRKAVPLGREEYAEWRVKVELERRGIEV